MLVLSLFPCTTEERTYISNIYIYIYIHYKYIIFFKYTDITIEIFMKNMTSSECQNLRLTFRE